MTPQALHTVVDGSGPPLVLIHGWGLGLHVFDPVVGDLARSHRVVRVDLPGCGGSRPDRCGADLTGLARAVLAVSPRPAHWVGWSLGGLVALAAARLAPEVVGAVTLVASNPCFAGAPDWPGVDDGTLADFADAVTRDPAAAHARFLGFQLAGSDEARSALRALRAACTRDGRPDGDTLEAGLALLRDTDLRAVCRRGALSCPVRAILGGADPLVPAAVGARLRASGRAVALIDGAGHAPFASHPARFVEALAGAGNPFRAPLE